MKERYFLFDYSKKDWYESHEQMAGTDMKDIPLVQVISYANWFADTEEWEKAWCEQHHAYEDIQESGEGFVLTKAGCRLEGAVLFSEQRDPRDPWEVRTITGRYCVCHDPEQGLITVHSESAYVALVEGLEPVIKSWHEHVYSWRMPTGELNASHFYSPSVIEDAVLDAMAEELEKHYGFPPKVLRRHWNDRIKAFLQNPWDMNICYFQPYFDEETFQKLFPKEQQDNFAVLCRAFGLDATQMLRQAYEKNPYAVPIAMMLIRLGISQQSLWPVFFDLDEFCGEEMGLEGRWHQPLVSLSEDEQQTLTYSDDYDELEPQDLDLDFSPWENLCFYCSWHLTRASQEHLAEWLRREQEGWWNGNWKILDLFRRYFASLPEAWKEDILREGLSSELHDRLCMFREERDREKEAALKQDPLECSVGGFHFRRIRSAATAQNISIAMYLCDAFRQDYHSGKFYVVERNGCCLAWLHLKGKKEAGNWISRYNPDVINHDPVLFATVDTVIDCWMRHFGVKQSCRSPVKNEQDFPVEPLEKQWRWEDMSLRQLLEVPQEDISQGYYRQLYFRFVETGLVKYSYRASRNRPDNEMERLMKMFPQGKRIYEAAFAGDPEAQYVLSRMYRESACLTNPNFRRSSEWYREARKNGWGALAQRTVSLDFSR